MADDGHGAPVGFEEMIDPLHLAVLIRVFQSEQAVGDDTELGAIADFHPPMQGRFHGQPQLILMHQPDATLPADEFQRHHDIGHQQRVRQIHPTDAAILFAPRRRIEL